jgi:hypothetical protein
MPAGAENPASIDRLWKSDFCFSYSSRRGTCKGPLRGPDELPRFKKAKEVGQHGVLPLHGRGGLFYSHSELQHPVRCARGWQIVEEFTDQGVSGCKESRPALNRLMSDACRRRFDAILVWKIDRFGRSPQAPGQRASRTRGTGSGLALLINSLQPPSRLKPPGLIARIILGGLSGAGVAVAGAPGWFRR